MDERIEELNLEASASPLENPHEKTTSEEQLRSEQVFEKTEKRGEKMDELLARIDTHTSNLQASSPNQVKDDAASLSEEDEEMRISKLLSLADTKGVVHAVNVARTLEDFYALDMFRDTLIEQFHKKIDQSIQ
jgi:ABC-type phosphate transport system auxiliary subunit